MNNPSICFFNTTKSWGGGEQWHYDAARLCASKGLRVIVFVNKNSELYKRLQGEKNIDLHIVKIGGLSFLNVFKVNYLKRIFRKLNIGAIIMNLPSDAKAAGVAAKHAGIKNIIYRRGSAIPIKNSILNRFLFKNIITQIIANSQETKRTILANNPSLFPADKITVLYNGIDLNRFVFSSKISNYPETPFIIGNAGRLDKQKGQHYLFDLAEILLKNGFNFRIKIAGKGKLELELKQETIARNLSEHIEFLGFSEQIESFFEQIDVFVLTSLWEGFGYVIAEAAACGKPVLAFDISSNPELIEHEKTGYLIPPFDIEILAQRIIYLANNQPLLAKMRTNARQMVEQRFSKDAADANIHHYLIKLLT